MNCESKVPRCSGPAYAALVRMWILKGMSEENTLNFFCRGCGYSLQGLESTRCPECGRTFDRSRPGTMSRSSKLIRHRRIRRAIYGIIAALLMCGYVGMYLKFVQVRQPPNPARSAKTLPIPPGWIVEGYPGDPEPYYPRATPAIASYPKFPEALERLFAPINWIDRHTRKDLWSYYDIGYGIYLAKETNAAARTLAEAAQLNRPDLTARQNELLDQFNAMTVFKPGTPRWIAAKSRAITTGELLKQEMRKPPSDNLTTTQTG